MPFPLNPTNGQQATVNGVVYTYNSTATVWSVLTTTSANINVGTVTATGNISGNYILGNAAFMSGIPASYTNSNVTSLLASFGSNTISTTGNVSTGNVSGTTGAFTNVSGTLTTASQPNITAVGTLSSLTVSGAFSAGTITETSNRELKTNFRKIENALDTVLKLSAYIYDRKDGSETDELGLVVEDVDPVINNLVMYDDLGKPVGVKYTRIGVLCIEAIKELKNEIDALRNQ